VLHGRVQGNESVGGDEERASVHVRHEELSAQTRREGVPESGGKRTESGAHVIFSVSLSINPTRVFIPLSRLQLKPTEFLNLDVILEGVMNRLVLRELREHIYSLLVDEYVNNGSIPSMVENIHYAKSKSIQDFAVRVSVSLLLLLVRCTTIIETQQNVDFRDICLVSV